MRTRWVAVVAVVVACGGGGDANPPLTTELNGAWGGTAYVGDRSRPGVQQTTRSVSIDVSGHTATVAFLCGEEAPATFTGSGDTATWEGSLTCDWVGYGCDSVQLTFSALTLKYVAPSEVFISGRGTIHGCGFSYEEEYLFCSWGTKRARIVGAARDP